MSARRHSYSPTPKLRQSPRILPAAATALIALSLGGCAGLGLPIAREMTALDTTTTGSIRPTLVSATVVDGVAASDWEAIRRTVAATRANTAVDRLGWTNPDTGSAGSIVGLSAAALKGGMPCRTFATTVNDQRGVRRYRGEACEHGNGRWQLYGMVADDAQLS